MFGGGTVPAGVPQQRERENERAWLVSNAATRLDAVTGEWASRQWYGKACLMQGMGLDGKYAKNNVIMLFFGVSERYHINRAA